jgi:hypothetical protein
VKKIVLLVLAVFVLAMGSSVSAKQHHDWSKNHFNNGRWQRVQYVPERTIPFAWHEHRDRIGRANPGLKRIYDRRLSERFPGLHAYKWQDHGKEFYYQGRRIDDAILFYDDDSDELVSVGFMRNGSFVLLRDDDRGYETKDEFFTSWLKVLLIHEIVNG